MTERTTRAKAKRPARARKPPAAPKGEEPAEPERIDAGDFAAAMELSDRLDQPVRVPTEHHLDTGLADYGMWVRLFAAFPPRKPDPRTFRRGRIWA